MKQVTSKLTSVFLVLKRKWKLVTFLAILTLLAGGWWYRSAQAAKPVLTFERPTRETLIKTLDVSGIVDAKEKARLRFLAGGKLTYLGAQEGDAVEKWQTLAVIDQATLKKQLEQDLNLFMKERLDWDQQNDDVFFNEYTEREERQVQQGQLDLTNEVLDVEIRDIAIQNTRLYAPFDGIITVAPTTTTGVQLLSTDYFELINPATLIFRAEVDEADIASVKIGQNVTIELDAHPDKTITTSVNYIAFTSSQTANGTVFLVEMPLDTTVFGMDFYRLGMNGDVAIELDRRTNVLSIPLIAIKERDDKTFVDVRTGEDTYEEREIEVGLETEEKVEVVSGLSENNEILIPE